MVNLDKYEDTPMNKDISHQISSIIIIVFFWNCKKCIAKKNLATLPKSMDFPFSFSLLFQTSKSKNGGFFWGKDWIKKYLFCQNVLWFIVLSFVAINRKSQFPWISSGFYQSWASLLNLLDLSQVSFCQCKWSSHWPA